MQSQNEKYRIVCQSFNGVDTVNYPYNGDMTRFSFQPTKAWIPIQADRLDNLDITQTGSPINFRLWTYTNNQWLPINQSQASAAKNFGVALIQSTMNMEALELPPGLYAIGTAAYNAGTPANSFKGLIGNGDKTITNLWYMERIK